MITLPLFVVVMEDCTTWLRIIGEAETSLERERRRGSLGPGRAARRSGMTGGQAFSVTE